MKIDYLKHRIVAVSIPHRGCAFLGRQLETATLNPYLRSRWIADLDYMRERVGGNAPDGACPD